MIDSHRVGPEIVALVQHVELNESGWIDTAITKAVRFLFWMLSEPASETTIFDERTKVGLTGLKREHIHRAIKSLADAGVLVQCTGERHKLAEQEIVSINSAVEAASNIEITVKEKVLAAAHLAAPDLPENEDSKLWERFHGEFVAPFIEEFGARAYELITGAKTDVHQTAFISEFLSKFPSEQKTVLEAMILALLDKNSQSCRTYTLRMLNSYFFHSALTLSSDVVAKLFSPSNGRTKKLKLVLDTNFLFSLFKLHSNPSNEAVSLLLSTISRVPPQISISMYVLPETIKEFRRALVNYESLAKSIRVTSNIIDAGISSNISGVLETYFQRVRNSGYKISTDDYFRPFHDDIVTLLRQHNVTILNGEDEKYSTDQNTIDDAVEQQSFYKAKFINDKRRQKSYEQIWHDMVLWHYISDRRPTISDTVFEAEWVGVTIDYGLMAFDSHKRKARGIPSMVHPAALVQALQMLIPTDENLERTILALMQMPFLFEDFNIEDEKITQRILSSLSRFENIDDLSAEAIIELLGNKALRSQMEKQQNKDEELILIKDAIIEHAADLERQTHAAQRDLATSMAATRQAEEAYEAKITSLAAQKVASERQKQAAEEAAAKLIEERDRTKSELEALQSANVARDLRQSFWKQALILALQALACIAVVAFIINLSIEYWGSLAAYGWWVPYALAFAAVSCAAIAIGHLTERQPLISESRWGRVLPQVGKQFKKILLFLILSVVGPLIYDTVKPSIM